MELPDIIPFPIDRVASSARQQRAILLTSYNTGAAQGKNLGVAGYSHDIVARLFHKQLSRWGQVIYVPNPREDLNALVEQTRQRGLDPVHVGILPIQDFYLADAAPNIVVPAWEFPDIPNEGFDGNPQNDWASTADRCTSLIVGGPFTQNALQNAGVKSPIHIVPVPTPVEYFELLPWNPADRTTIQIPAYVLPQAIPSRSSEVRGSARNPNSPPKKSWLKRTGIKLEESFRGAAKRLTGEYNYDRHFSFIRCLRAASHAYRETRRHIRYGQTLGKIPFTKSHQFEASGIVYTSIFNPSDGRKNWEDLITGFLIALGDREDTTLIVKLISSDPFAVRNFTDYYYHRDIPHRCRIVIITDYLSEEQLVEIAKSSTYYLQTTKAEGNCLPLMNYLAAGRPGISPCHSAIKDYFDEDVGFVVDSHPEPAAWPHDSRLRIRTSWARIVWPSLVNQLKASYELAKNRPAEYQHLSARCQQRLRDWASEESVWEKLKLALDASTASTRSTQQPPVAMKKCA